MRRLTLAALAALTFAAAAPAHFVFVVPKAGSDTAKVIFSDSLDPDVKYADRVAAAKLTARDADGKDTPLELAKGAEAYTVTVPGTGPRVVFGTAVYGVSQRGQAKPGLLTYHPKAFVGGTPSIDRRTVGTAPVEVVPAVVRGQVTFSAVLKGKPFAKAKFTVRVPGSDEAVRGEADEEGVFKQSFDKPGTYAVVVGHEEEAAGEHGGKKYEVARHYATLVMELGDSTPPPQFKPLNAERKSAEAGGGK